jgi:hypothetical protein
MHDENRGQQKYVLAMGDWRLLFFSKKQQQ